MTMTRHDFLKTISAGATFSALPDDQRLPAEGGIEGDWLSAIIEGRQACAGVDYSARLTEFTLLGNIAKRADIRLIWDEAAMKVTNIEKANAWITCFRRPGWEL